MKQYQTVKHTEQNKVHKIDMRSMGTGLEPTDHFNSPTMIPNGLMIADPSLIRQTITPRSNLVGLNEKKSQSFKVETPGDARER